MSRASQVIVLCEDLQQAVFLRRLLKGLGVSPRRIRINQAPSGEGSAEQYVRDHYPVEVKAHREKVNHLEVRLVTMIDADTLTLMQRQQQLNDRLQEASLSARQPDECIAVLMPRRNIETWIHFLRGQDVDESTLYPKLSGNESDCQPAVDELLSHLKGISSLTNSPNSLEQGSQELRTHFIECQYRQGN